MVKTDAGALRGLVTLGLNLKNKTQGNVILPERYATENEGILIGGTPFCP